MTAATGRRASFIRPVGVCGCVNKRADLCVDMRADTRADVCVDTCAGPATQQRHSAVSLGQWEYWPKGIRCVHGGSHG